MRWVGVIVALLSASCLRQEDDTPDASAAEDAGAPFDPCAWDGRGGYCYADQGYVFSGGGCVSICAPSSGTNGRVFDTQEECAATCLCRPAKISGSLGLGEHCDRVVAFLDVDAERDWPEWCVGRQCVLPISGTIDLNERGTICGYSSSTLVREVACIDQD